MYSFLYPEPILDRVALRAEARQVIESSPLMQACAGGHLESIQALLVGFWPYVAAFEKAIDQQVARLPVKRLMSRFGQQRIHEFFQEAKSVVREMKEEEGSHAQLWRRSAEQLGAVLGDREPVGGVKRLLQSVWTDDPMQFFCWLAGTEYIAEELAAYLCGSPAFLAHFPDNCWMWGDAHAAEHHGPSHLEIDEDLARAFHASADADEVVRDLMTTYAAVSGYSQRREKTSAGAVCDRSRRRGAPEDRSHTLKQAAGKANSRAALLLSPW